MYMDNNRLNGSKHEVHSNMSGFGNADQMNIQRSEIREKKRQLVLEQLKNLRENKEKEIQFHTIRESFRLGADELWQKPKTIEVIDKQLRLAEQRKPGTMVDISSKEAARILQI